MNASEEPNSGETPRPDVETLLAEMDALVARGKAAVESWERFASEHDIQEGVGTEVLTHTSAPGRRHVYNFLIGTLTDLDGQIGALAEQLSPPKTSTPVGARAAGHRYRI